MTVAQSDKIARSIQQKTTEELLEIWANNDREQWSDSAFSAISQVISQRGVIVPPQGAFVPPAPRYMGVHGWLLFFCISLTILNPLSILASLGAVSTSDMFHDFRPAFMIVEFLSLIFAGFFIYVGVCLWRVKPGAVKKARVFLCCVIVIGAVAAITGSFPDANGKASNEVTKSVGGIISAIVWLVYLGSSKRVKATYRL